MPSVQTAAGAPLSGHAVGVSALAPRLAVALFVVGLGMLNAANAGWCHIIGALALVAFVIVGFVAVVPRAFAADQP